MTKRLLNATAMLGVLLAGPAFAQSDTPAPAPPVAAPAAPAPATIDAHPALWVVKDSDTTIYLFGTVHVLKPGVRWFDDGVKAAFDKSDRLVLELPDSDPAANQPMIIKLATDPNGRKLTDKLPAAVRERYVKAMAGLGLPATALDAFEPWFASVNLSLIPLLKLGYDPNSGAEKTLSTAAKAEHKPISGFESLDQQLGYFDTLPEALQIKFLDQTVQELPKAGETIDKMVDQWARGDPEALGATLNEGLVEQPEIGRILLTDRNRRWAEVIADMMKRPGTIFIAVGAGHLAGKNSVQAMLGKYRLKAVRVAD
ncbi:MAG: TraB/GumN family protein [Sphingomonas sp. 28-66-16]|nr:MAG: TraB/GumN family protein [Sphingomonas sp. 28-66-16]